MHLPNNLTQHLVRRPQRIALLQQVAEQGSITRAAKAAGLSYKGAWDAIDELNNLAGQPLVERSVGGKGGGGASLTATGERLVALYLRLEQLQNQLFQAADESEDLALLSRLMLRTSARNQLGGRILAIHAHGRHDHIEIALDEQQRLLAQITRDSTERLQLKVGGPVTALFKAGWLQLQPLDAARQDNQLRGEVEVIFGDGEEQREVRIVLPGGQRLQALVDFAVFNTLNLQLGQALLAHIDPAQILLGTSA